MIYETNILGGSFITGSGSGTIGSLKRPMLAGIPVIPPPGEVFSTVPARYGRFDAYTRLGCAAIALALRNACPEGIPGKTGVVISTGYECMQTDMAYYETVSEAEGQFSSPHLFSYTLPGIVIGESAILFKLTGPGFTLGQPDRAYGINALITAMELLQSGQADTMAAGWLDAPPDTLPDTASNVHGAAFIVLGKRDMPRENMLKLRLENGLLTADSGQSITSILDMFTLQASP